jgi:hypothetical protein
MKQGKTAKRGKKNAEAPVEENRIQEDRVQFIERPNGVYWRTASSETEYGPFATLAEATADAEGREDPTFQATDSVAEAEAEVGISEWIDPDTGEPGDESTPRIEDH